jgi:hypothetical protein
MSNQTTAFIHLSPEIQRLFTDNDLDLVTVLQAEGAAVSRGSEVEPGKDAVVRAKVEPITLLASSAVIMALTPLLIRIVERLARKQALVKEREWVPVLDSKGNVVRDAKGNPQLRLVERSRFVSTPDAPPETTTVRLKGPLRLDLSLTTKRG